jgi:hypothetical protein
MKQNVDIPDDDRKAKAIEMWNVNIRTPFLHSVVGPHATAHLLIDAAWICCFGELMRHGVTKD